MINIITATQQQLNKLGYNVTVDGALGPETEAALRKFQVAAGITADGVPGPQTSAALARALASKPSVGAPATPTATSRKPAKGTTTMGNTVQEITDAANFANSMFSQFSGLVSIFMPAQFKPFWAAAQIAIPAALNGLATVAQQVGTAQAGTVMAAHNTAGQANAPQLAPSTNL